MNADDDHKHLRAAIAESRVARDRGDGPYGAVLVSADGTVLGTAGNTRKTSGDVTAHAETNVVRMTCEMDPAILRAATMYASGEPCPMCAGAIAAAGIGRVVFGIRKVRISTITPHVAGVIMPVAQLLAKAQPKVVVEGPVLEDEAAEIFVGR